MIKALKIVTLAGAMDVHNNWREDPNPEFGEAASDYLTSIRNMKDTQP
jgi:hypothetical protein